MAFSWTTCKPRVTLQPVLIGDTRIVGTVTAGAITWQPGESPAGTYYVVTPALIRTVFLLAMENQELQAEIKKLQAKEK